MNRRGATTSSLSELLLNGSEDATGLSLVMAYSVDKSDLPPSTMDNITLYCDKDREAELIAKPLRAGFIPSISQWFNSPLELVESLSRQLIETIRAAMATFTPLTITFPLLLNKNALVNAYNPIFDIPKMLGETAATGFTFSAICFMDGKAYDMHDTITSISMPHPSELSLTVDLTGEIAYTPSLNYISVTSTDYISSNTDFMKRYANMITHLMNFISYNPSVSMVLIQVHVKGLPRSLKADDVPCTMLLRFLFPVFRAEDDFWQEHLCTDFPAADFMKASGRYNLGNMALLDKLSLACYVNYGRLFFSAESAPDTLPTCAYQQYAYWKLSPIPLLDGNGNPEFLPTSSSISSEQAARSNSYGRSIGTDQKSLKKMVQHKKDAIKRMHINKDFVLSSFSLEDYITTKTLSALAKVLHSCLFLRTARTIACLALPSEFLYTKAAAIAAFSFVACFQRGQCIPRSQKLTHEAELADRIRYVLNELHSLESIAKSSALMEKPSSSSFESRPDRSIMYANIPNPEVRILLEQKDDFIEKLEDCIKVLEEDNSRLRQEAMNGRNERIDQPSSFFDSIFIDDSSVLHGEKDELVNDIDEQLKNLVRQQMLSKQQLMDLQRMASGDGSAQLLERLQKDLDSANIQINSLESELRNSKTALHAEQDSCGRLRREVEDLVAQLERNGSLASITTPNKAMRTIPQPPAILPQILVPSNNSYTEDDVRKMRQDYEDKIYKLKEQHLMDIANHKAEINDLKKVHTDQLESFKQAVKNRYIKERDREYAKMKKQLENDYLLKLREIKIKVKEAMLGKFLEPNP